MINPLLDRGCDPSSTDRNGCNSLIYAIRGHYDVKMLKLLTDKGADFLCPDKHGCFPLAYAVQEEDEDVQRFLIDLASERGDSNGMRLQVCSRDKDGLTPLMHAAKAGRQLAVDLLLQNGASIDDYDNKKETALTHAVTERKSETALWLLSKGAECNTANSWGRTPLIQACRLGEMSVVRDLVEYRADVNATDICGRNALHYALCYAPHLGTAYNRHDLLDHLFLAGADRSAKDACGWGVLEYACLGAYFCHQRQAQNFFVSVVLVDLLRTQKVSSIEDASSNVFSLLHMACMHGDLELLKFLVDAGIKVTTISTTEPLATWSPLDIAIYCENGNLITANGDLRTNLLWKDLLPSGIVIVDDESPTEVRAFRQNSFKGGVLPAESIFCEHCFYVRALFPYPVFVWTFIGLLP